MVEQQKQKKQESKDKPKDKKDEKPSAFALECKKKADALVLQYRFSDAYNIMNEGLKKDKTVGLFKDFIDKLQGVAKIMEGGN